jgi:Skp family chaperone for outer membrane proteins
MKITLYQISFFLFLGLILATTLSFASQDGQDQTTVADVKKEAAQTYQALKSYTLDQRDEAMNAAKEKLQELDANIAEAERNLDQRWQKMNAAAREKRRQTLDRLRKERQQVAEWYGGMRHSSVAAWEEVKMGFADSYDRLNQAVKDAVKEYQ